MDELLLQFFAMDNDDEEMRVIVEELIEPLPEVNELVMRQRRARPRNRNYYGRIVPRYDDVLFKEHFRMSRGTFEDLVNEIGHAFPGNRNYLANLGKKVMFVVWVLAKPESFLAAGNRFGLAKSSGYYIFKEIVTVLTERLPIYVTWPRRERHEADARIFERRSHGIPGVVGVIDGCHIPIKAPIGNAHDFYNRKGFHSIVLQGVCDSKARFIDVYIGLPGRMHDAHIFRQSELYRHLMNDQNPLLPPHMHLLGDSAYPLLQNLMTPFRDTGHLTVAQINYNIKLSSIRSIIERAFGLLKGKFRRLKYLDISDLNLGNDIIAAACILHNFLIDRNEVDFEIEEFVEEIYQIDAPGEIPGNENITPVNKRNRIVELL